MIIDLLKAKKADLEAELELYREGGVENVPESDDVKTNKLMVEAIEELKKSEGIPVKITDEFINENPIMVQFFKDKGEDFTVGEIVFVEEAEIEAVDKLIQEDKDAKQAEEDKIAAENKAKEDAEKAEKKEPAGKVEGGLASAGNSELVYQGKTVTLVQNVIVSGKTYKDVSVASGETFRLSPEEFEANVKPRSEIK